MHFFRALLVSFPALMFGGLFDWFWDSPSNEKLDFYCPYQCGEWGSESIQKLEWKFVECLYEAQLLKYYNESTQEMIPTTMATIHYSKKGAHFVPAAPKK
jgi:hypothetical protein